MASLGQILGVLQPMDMGQPVSSFIEGRDAAMRQRRAEEDIAYDQARLAIAQAEEARAQQDWFAKQEEERRKLEAAEELKRQEKLQEEQAFAFRIGRAKEAGASDEQIRAYAQIMGKEHLLGGGMPPPPQLGVMQGQMPPSMPSPGQAMGAPGSLDLGMSIGEMAAGPMPGAAPMPEAERAMLEQQVMGPSPAAPPAAAPPVSDAMLLGAMPRRPQRRLGVMGGLGEAGQAEVLQAAGMPPSQPSPPPSMSPPPAVPQAAPLTVMGVPLGALRQTPQGEGGPSPYQQFVETLSKGDPELVPAAQAAVDLVTKQVQMGLVDPKNALPVLVDAYEVNVKKLMSDKALGAKEKPRGGGGGGGGVARFGSTAYERAYDPVQKQAVEYAKVSDPTRVKQAKDRNTKATNALAALRGGSGLARETALRLVLRMTDDRISNADRAEAGEAFGAVENWKSMAKRYGFNLGSKVDDQEKYASANASKVTDEMLSQIVGILTSIQEADTQYLRDQHEIVTQSVHDSLRTQYIDQPMALGAVSMDAEKTEALDKILWQAAGNAANLTVGYKVTPRGVDKTGAKGGLDKKDAAASPPAAAVLKEAEDL